MEPRQRAKPPFLPYYQLYLSLRYLQSRISAIAALLSITFGVAVILIVLSIMGGYVDALKETIRGQEAPLMVLGLSPFSVTRITKLQKTIESVENVRAATPFLESLAMYKSGALNPCQLRGIDPAGEALVSDIGRYVLRDDELESILADLASTEDDAAPVTGTPGGELLISRVEQLLRKPERAPLSPDELSRLFEPSHGVEVLRKRNPKTLEALGPTILPTAVVGIHFLLERKVFLGQALEVGTIQPDTQKPVDERFVVGGAFRTGDYDFDSKVIFIHADVLKNLLGLFDAEAGSYRYEGLRVALRDIAAVDETKRRISIALMHVAPNLRVLSWEQLNPNRLTAVVIEKFVIYFLLVLLMSFTGCMVLLMLLLTVIEKTRDVGILLALGATPGGVVKIFLTSGLFLIAAGTSLGLFVGFIFCHYINPIHDAIYAWTGWKLFPPEIYHMDRIPIAFRASDVLLSVAPPLVLGFLSSLIPAIWASRRDPIKAIHYE